MDVDLAKRPEGERFRMQDNGKTRSKDQATESLDGSLADDTLQEVNPVPSYSLKSSDQASFTKGTTPMPMALKRQDSPPSTFPNPGYSSDGDGTDTDVSGRKAETVSMDDTDRIARGGSEQGAGRSAAERTRVSTREDETDSGAHSNSEWSSESENGMVRTAIHTPPPGSGLKTGKEVFQRVVSPPQGTPLRRRSNVQAVAVPSILSSTTFRLLIAAILMLVLLTGLLIYLSVERGKAMESASMETGALVAIEAPARAEAPLKESESL